MCPNTVVFLVRIFPYSARMRENTYQKNSVLGRFSRSALFLQSQSQICFIYFLFFRRNQKQEVSFQQVDGLATKELISYKRFMLYFKGMSNSIHVY